MRPPIWVEEIRWERKLMNEMLRDRGKLVVLAAAAVVAIFGYLAVGRGGGAADDVATKAASTGVVGSRHLAEDESAKALLRTGRIAMESLFSGSQSFAGGIAAVAQIEPNIAWVSGDAASAPASQVALTVPSEQSYVLSTTSASGTTFTYRRSEVERASGRSAPGSGW
jgi:hypothetical protein